MSQYFSAFPSINYSGTNAKNITLRTNIVNSFRQNANNFYPYTIKDGETADALAYDYYGDSNYIWVIYMVNNIIDPYYEWPLDTVEFEKFITSKYGSLAEAKETVAYYKKIPVDYYVNDVTNEYILASLYDPAANGYSWTKVTIDDNIKISAVTNPNPAVWQEVDVYTDEFEQNENKRHIRLLDNSFITAIDRQLRDVMNG
jgi:hypothetical protein